MTFDGRQISIYCLGFLRSHKGDRAEAIRYAREQIAIDVEGAQFWGAVASYLGVWGEG